MEKNTKRLRQMAKWLIDQADIADDDTKKEHYAYTLNNNIEECDELREMLTNLSMSETISNDARERISDEISVRLRAIERQIGEKILQQEWDEHH